MLDMHLIYEKIININDLIININNSYGLQRSDLIKNRLSRLINESCDFIRGKEEELLSTEEVVKALSKCNFTDPNKYKVIGINFNNFDYLAMIIYRARQENDKVAFISEKIAEINSLIIQINDLDGYKRSELIKNSLSPLINECYNFIYGREKELLSIKNIIQALSKCNLANPDEYKIVSINFNNIDYLAWIIKISIQSSSYKFTFHLLDGVLYLLSNDLCIGNIRERNILLVGENDFSFAYSYIVTHKDKSRNLIASEYQLLYKDLNDAVIYLLGLGVMIAYGMDATKLQEYRHLSIGSFQRIQFNCPYDTRDGTTEGSIQKTYTKKLVKDFMASAKHLLHPTGKLHVAIQQPKNPGLCQWGKKEYQNAWGLASSACLHQFKLFKVIGNIQDRYSNKVHKSLQGDKPIVTYVPYLGQGKNLRINQFIFKHNGPLDILDYLEYTTDNETDSENELNLHYCCAPEI